MEDVAAHNRISERATLRWIDIPFLDNPNFQGFTTPAALEEHLQKLAEHRAVLGRPLHKRNKDGSFGTHTGRSLVQYLGKLVQEQACTPQQRTSSLFRSHGSAALTEAFRTTLDWSPERAWGTDEDEVAFETACLQAARPMESGDDGFFETLREGDLSRRCRFASSSDYTDTLH